MKSNFRQPNKTQRTEDNPALAVEIGSRIHRLRVDAKISQGYVAGRMGVFQSVLSNIEQGRNCPSIAKIIPIANALSCSMDYLILGKHPDTQLQAKLSEANREIERLRSALDNIIKFAKESKKP